VRRLAVVSVLAWGAIAGAGRAGEPELRVVRHGERFGVEVYSEGRGVLASPGEGLWSIATDWRDGWPAEWRHAQATEVEKAGPWTILRAELEARGGTWQLRDAYRPRGRAIECVRRFTWNGEEDARRCTLSVRWAAKTAKARVLLPGIIYHGNPSGAASGRVPVFSGKAGEEAIFEEHRYPVPFASIEWSDAAGLRGAALGSVPSPAPYGNLPDQWRPRSTDEAFFIAPLCEASVLLDSETYRRAAVKAAEHYAARHVSMREPYWGGTLDARCEDKEGAYAALQGFLAVYELTGEARFLDWAEHACDVVLTYLVLWDIDLPPGRLRNHGFKTRGWTVVSPQNQHIDAYGVVIAPDVYRLGQILRREDLRRLAILMYRSCGQLIDPYGSQGEQPQHTNYAQRGKVDDVFALRGGYAETWTVFWITAHFLNAGARFAELGVPVWE
jgi:hypothetical protein